MTEYVVYFGDEKSSAFVRLAMAQVEANGARLCEEIVRCRDCVHFEPTAKNGICHRSEFLPMWAEPNGFCKWAERKEGGDER